MILNFVVGEDLSFRLSSDPAAPLLWGCEIDELYDLAAVLMPNHLGEGVYRLSPPNALSYLLNMWRVRDMTDLVKALNSK